MAAGLQGRPELQGSGRSVWWCGCWGARDVRAVIGHTPSVRTLSLAHSLEPRDAIGGRLASREGLGRCGLPGSPDPLAVRPPEWVPRRQVVSVALLQLTASLFLGTGVFGFWVGAEVWESRHVQV